jgi:prepilin peptidase CpaA
MAFGPGKAHIGRDLQTDEARNRLRQPSGKRRNMSIVTIAAATGLCFLGGTVVLAGVRDFATMTISNRLVLALLAGYALFALVGGLGLAAMGAGLLVGLAILLSAFILFAAGAIGGGDAKLAAAISLWLGPAATAGFLLYTAVFGALYALLVLIVRPAAPDGVERIQVSAKGIPFAVPMAIATLLMLPQTQWAVLAGY